ncbi:hypothetical protein B7494_g5793 [Chlorociboria aeruginascens]|nr:hypothetical protein B7494_g5793 [Chlorociboria aeruginascens]
MDSKDELDFGAERQYLEKRIATFSAVDEIQENLIEIRYTLGEKRSYYATQNARAIALKNEIIALEASHKELAKEHENKEASYRENVQKLKKKVRIAIPGTSADEQRISVQKTTELEAREKLAEENLALARNKEPVVECQKLLETKKGAYHNILEDQKPLKQTIEDLEKQIITLEKEHEDAIQQWREMWHESNKRAITDGEVERNLSKSYEDIIRDLKEENAALNATIEAHQEREKSDQEKLKTKDNEIWGLKRLSEKADERLNTKRADITALKEEIFKIHDFKRLAPLVWAGLQIRNRVIELEKKSPNPTLLDRGEEACHLGMAQADAALYRPYCPQARTDVETYKSLYGVDPQWVWDNRESKRLLDILDWRASMKFFHVRSLSILPFETTPFHKEWAAVMKGKEKFSARNFDKFLGEDHAGVSKYDDMKRWYNIHLEKYKKKSGGQV